MSFLKKSNTSAVDLLAEVEQLLAAKCNESALDLKSISQKIDEDWEKNIRDKTSFIIEVNKGREALKEVISAQKKNKKIKLCKKQPQYQISSLFLKECWEYLSSDPEKKERLHLVTGTITDDGVRVLSKMEKLQYSTQSAAYVKADNIDAHTKIITLSEKYGHLLLAMFHSHISNGLNSTSPSSIDKSFMERMEKLGIECIGGIFSLDGFVRFFSVRNFEIDVYGKGVKKIQDKPCQKIFQMITKGERQ